VLPADNHVHSQWSYDTFGRTSMAAACARAVELGIPAVAFTEHLDFTEAAPGDAIGTTGTGLGWWDAIRPLDVQGYLASLEECRYSYPSLRIVSGVEIGEPHLFAASAGAVLGSATFDRVLGSLHALTHDGRLANSASLFRVLPAAEVMRRYFTEEIALIKSSGLFEVLAHLDYPRRHWPAAAGPFSEPDFEEEYRAVLRALATSGRVLELNTLSPLASATLAGWWREEGGTAISFGSDAHVPWRVGDKFREAVDVAEAAGFSQHSDLAGFWRR
jgi:histidinol-phosphatase (PHP family)